MNIEIYENCSFELQLLQFSDARHITAENFDGNYKATFWYGDSQNKTIGLVLTVGNGISVSDNVITISRSTNQNTLKSSVGQYFLDLRNDVDADNSMPIFQECVSVKPFSK